MRSVLHARKLRIAVGVATLLTVSGLAIALPGSAQNTVACGRAEVSENGELVVESWIGPPPCPEGFTQADDNGSPTESSTTEAPTTTTTVAPATTVAPTTTAVTEPAPAETTTTVATDEVTEESPTAEAVEGEPTYTG